MKQRHGKNKKLRFVISSLLSFLLAILLTAGTVVVGVNIGFLNKNRILDCLNYRKYYSGVEEYFYQNAKDITTPIGLPENVVDNIISSEEIYEAVKGYVNASVDGKSYTFRTDELKSRLSENVKAYFSEKGLTMNTVQQQTIPEYTQLIADEYVSNLKVPFVGRFHQFKQIGNKVMLVTIGVVILLAAVISFILIKMYHWKHRAIRFLVYSTIAATVMSAAPAAVALISGFYRRINISSEYVYYAFVNYIENGFKAFLYLSAGWAVISFGLLMLIKYLRGR